MDQQSQSVPAENSMYKLACVLLPDPPRFLHLTSLSKASRKAVPWIAALVVQSAVLLVPGLLWLTAALLCLYLLVAYGAIQYLKAARQRQAELTDAALTPESIIGTSSEWQSEASTADQGQGVPQGDASSLPVNRSMQQPREQELKYDTDALFSNIQDIQQKLYGSEAAGEIQGKRDLATAAAEIDRLCSALGIPATNLASHTAKSLRQKLDALRAEVG